QTLSVSASSGVLANDSDSAGYSLTVGSNGNPSNGTLTLNSDGSFTYTPSSSFVGTDSFTYAAWDGYASSNTATVSISVSAPPQANDDSYHVGPGQTLTVAAAGVLANDSDPAGYALTVSTNTNPS